MTNKPYNLSDAIRLLRDSEVPERNMTIDALVASGDCFITIATALDQYAHLHASGQTVPAELEDAITTLLYLQRNYRAVRKPSDYRQ
ncbi:MAG: hypothetical protein JWN38_828 [Candidatus Saccharibacteria bacterium]|nr:hypothetical protein [Candidatus Saccharibacteria bacterium]